MPSTDTRTQHTPGPWFDTGLPQEHAIAIAADGPVHICRITRASMNAEANARLIAAAPDLLAALEECMRWLAKADADGAFANAVLPHGVEDYALPKAYAAIRKARGEE